MLHHWPIPGDQMSPPPATLLHAKDSINGSWIPSSTEQSLCKPLLFSRSARIGYLPLWMHQGLSPPWLITSRGFIATLNMKSRLAIKFPPPLWVVIKCPAPEKTKFVKFPPFRAGGDVKCLGYAGGECLSFDLTGTLPAQSGKAYTPAEWRFCVGRQKNRLSAVATTFL